MKKNKFIKEKIIYTSISVACILISIISISHAFPNNGTLKGDIPVIDFNSTEDFNITNVFDETKKIDVVMTSSKKNRTCDYTINFKFNDGERYITDMDNSILIVGYDSSKVIFEKELSSRGKDNFEKLADYQIKGENTVTQNLSFRVLYANEDSDKVYSGYIYLDNVICK